MPMPNVNPAGSLAGLVAIVTGGGSGIGRAAAELFCENGASVVIADTDEDGGNQTVQNIATAGGNASFIGTDVSDEESVAAMVSATVAQHGRLDVAFNNAGIAPIVKPTEELTLGEWEKLQSINLRGVWLCMKYELAEMQAAGTGSIVNTASVAGLLGVAGSSGYSASKHAVIGLTKSAAAEQGIHGIRVNAIAPGLTRTTMVEQLLASEGLDASAMTARSSLRRMAEPREIAEAAMWLASARSSFVTGHVLSVDGGETAA
jgi:NAD(P)-dependent dehydrogenase (short-subunit alcohol dehydrogenase family)